MVVTAKWQDGALKWPQPPFLIASFLIDCLTLTPAHRRQVAQALGYQGDIKDEIACCSWLAEQIAQPKAYSVLCGIIGRGRGKARLPRNRMIDLLYRRLEEEGFNAADLRTPDGGIPLWPLLSFAIDEASIMSSEALRADFSTGEHQILFLAMLCAWCASQEYLLLPSWKEFAPPAELYFLAGFARSYKDLQPWIDRFWIEIGQNEWIISMDWDLAPETGLFDDAWLQRRIGAKWSGKVALVGCLPDYCFEGGRGSSNPLGQYGDAMRRGFREASVLFAIADLVHGALGGSYQKFHYTSKTWNAGEICHRTNVDDFGAMSEEEIRDVAAAAWIYGALDGLKMSSYPKIAEEILIAAGVALKLPALEEAVHAFKRQINDMEMVRQEIVRERSGDVLSVTSGATELNSDQPKIGPKMTESSGDLNWTDLRASLILAVENLPSEPGLQAAEEFVAMAKDLRRAARVSSRAAEDAQAEKALAIRDRILSIQSRLQALEHDELAAVLEAAIAIDPNIGWRDDLASKLDSVDAAIDRFEELGAAINDALEAQSAAGNPSVKKQAAKTLLARSEALEAAVTPDVLEILDFLSRLTAPSASVSIILPVPNTFPSQFDGSASEVRSLDSDVVNAEAAKRDSVESQSSATEPSTEKSLNMSDGDVTRVANDLLGHPPVADAPTARENMAPQTPIAQRPHTETDEKPAERDSLSDVDEEDDGGDPQKVEKTSDHEATAAWSTLMRRDEPGLAWHLSTALEEIGRRPKDMPRPDYLEALCFGRTVILPGDPSATEMKDRLAPAIKDPANPNEAMLAMAAFIRPSLLAPETGCREYAIEINLGRITFMHALQVVLQKVQRTTVFLTPQTLRRQPPEKDMTERAKKARTELLEWCEMAPKLRFSFQRADSVWKTLFKRDGLIGVVVEAVKAGKVEVAAAAMRDFLKTYSGDDRAIDILVDRIDDDLNSAGGREPIIGHARNRLRELVHEVCARFEDWLENSFVRFDGKGDEVRIAGLRTEIESAAREASVGARKLVSTSADPYEIGAAEALADAMDDLLAAISPDGKGFRERDPRGLLHDGFLRVPGMIFGGDRRPEPYQLDEVTVALLTYAAESNKKKDWEEAFHDRLAEHSHIATQRILSILDARGALPAEIERLKGLREADIEQARHDLVRSRAELRNELDQAMAIDAIRSSSLSALLEEIEVIDPQKLPIDLSEPGATAPIADFPAAKKILEEVQRELKKAFVDVTGNIMAKMTSLHDAGKLDPDDEKRIRSRLGKGDYISAAEMLELVDEGESGFSRRQARPFNEYFPSACEAISAAHDQKLTKEILQALEKGRKDGPFDFTKLTEQDQRSDASRALHGWSHLKSPQKADKNEDLTVVLSSVGFRGVALKAGKNSDRKRLIVEMSAERISNQRICPIPHFGSMGQGQWRVTVWSGDATPDEIVNDVPKGSSVPDIAIVCSRMNADAKRRVAQLSRRDSKSLLVLDETLFLWLLMQAEYRLPLFFGCTLPFTWCDPYPSTEGPVPPESFYGRSAEIDKINDRFGSCLVFGGRQLGKTALLVQVCQAAHRPEDGQIALRLDLKMVGSDGRPDVLWARIGEELFNQDILKNRHAGAKDLSDAIVRWLSADPRRRMLLMLDEMDDFLVADGERGYENVVKMRELMDNTQRRCKFVLAGLHNVQRASTTVNTPLVHFGDPICVGPFDQGVDKAEARRMVIEPLAAAGYEFEESWLALRILSYLNYYPSLAAVFCKQLAERMSKKAARTGTGNNGPSWRISAKDIEEIMAGEEARKKIKWRFDITLDLDPRYKLTALILALRADADAERGLAQTPVSIQEIRSEAMSTWWPEGFKDRASVEAFLALLEEMQGLGVVSNVAGGWKLRSSRIASMMGKKQQIESDLLEFRGKQPPPLKWEPGLDRANLSGKNRRSPLNRLQEGEIFGLREPKVGSKDGKKAWVVFGSEAAGLDDVPEALQRISDDARLDRLSESPDKTDAKSFGWVLGRRVTEGKTRLFWVSPAYAWDETWLQEVMQCPGLKRSGLKVIFGGGPRHALSWAARGREFISDKRLGVAATQPVLGAAMRFWLKDIGLEALDSVGNLPKIEAATGGYAKLLESLATEFSQKGGGDPLEVIQNWIEKTPPERTLASIGVPPEMRSFLEELSGMPAGFGRGDMLALGELYEPAIMEGAKRVSISPEAAMSWAETMGFAFRSAKEPPMSNLSRSLAGSLAGSAGTQNSPISGTGSHVSSGLGGVGQNEAWTPNPILGRLFGRLSVAIDVATVGGSSGAKPAPDGIAGVKKNG